MRTECFANLHDSYNRKAITTSSQPFMSVATLEDVFHGTAGLLIKSIAIGGKLKFCFGRVELRKLIVVIDGKNQLTAKSEAG